MKYKVTYKNGAVQFGTMNTDHKDGMFTLNLFNKSEGKWVWNHKLGGISCFQFNINDPFVTSMEKILQFPELSR